MPDTASVYTGNDEIVSISRSKQQCDAPLFEVVRGVSDRYLHRLLCSVNTNTVPFLGSYHSKWRRGKFDDI